MAANWKRFVASVLAVTMLSASAAAAAGKAPPFLLPDDPGLLDALHEQMTH